MCAGLHLTIKTIHIIICEFCDFLLISLLPPVRCYFHEHLDLDLFVVLFHVQQSGSYFDE